MEINTENPVPLFGLPLIIKVPWLIGLGLILTSIYTTTRYWYFSTYVHPSRRRERQQIKNTVLPSSLKEKLLQILEKKIKAYD